jgi:D-proline reductase (dithiol) PrdB
MARTFEDPLLTRIHGILRAEVDPDFDFLEPGPVPFARLPKPASELRVALLTTASLHLKGDVPFRALEERFGDTSFRVIPRGAKPADLDLDAPYVDRRHVPEDPEVALPLLALESLHRDGLSGAPAARHASVSGGLVRPYPGLAETSERLAAMFHDDGAEAVLLFPSCPLCVQTVCLLAREFEGRGIATACLTLLPELSRIVGAPRTLSARFRFGAPCGDPGNGALHRAVLVELLELLENATEPGVLRESTLQWKRSPG